MSNFSGLNTGLSALMAHRRAAEVISQNIANVNTEGFSRRRADLQAEGMAAVAAVYSKGLDTGAGVYVEGITRIRDEFLETQHRNETALSADLSAQATVLSRAETAFPEPGDSGISHQLAEFWSAWDSVANQPEQEAFRTGVLEQANLLIQAVQQSDRQLRVVQADAADHVETIVDQVNSYAQKIAQFDQGIRAAVVAGQNANDLLDQRDVVATKLAELVGATIVQSEHGTIDVYVGGRALVHGDTAEQLKAVETKDTARGINTMTVAWAQDDYPATVTSGALKGYLDGANTLVPGFMDRLNGVVASIVTSVNGLHATGKDLDGVAGGDFFFQDATAVDGNTGLTATTVRLDPGIVGHPRKVVAAAADPTDPTLPKPGQLDNTVAHALAGLRNASNGPDATYQSLIIGIGSKVQYTKEQSSVQDDLVQRLDEDRKAVSGVNLDEEMVNLVAAQHAYSAAARVVTTIDEMLETLINGTGRVGR